MTTHNRIHPRYSRLYYYAGLAARAFFHRLDRWLTGRQGLDTRVFDVTYHELELQRLPASFDGYRLVHLTDLHTDSWLSPARLEALVPLINGLRADAIVITGDFISYRDQEALTDLRRPLLRLRARDGIFAVFGNHDYLFAYDDLAFILRTSGVTHLHARFHTIRRGADMLHIAGLDDMPNKPAFLERMLRQMPPEGAAILLVHKPDFADTAAASGRFCLSLAGHTHGGQIILPGIGPLFRPYGGRKYPLGLYRIGDLYHYTSRGLGVGDIPIRINCRPEIAVFTLRSPQTAQSAA